MRSFLTVVAGLVVLWAVWLRPVTGPPELVVTRFLQSVQRENWGAAQASLVQHMRGRIGQEGIGGGHASPEPVGAHGHPGRIDGDRFVHSHRFQLQREGRAWRIYQFEAVDGAP